MGLAGTLRRYRVPLAIGGGFFLFNLFTLLVGISTAWPTLVKGGKTIPEWLAERGLPSLTTLLIIWLGIVVVLTLAVIAFFVWLLRESADDAERPIVLATYSLQDIWKRHVHIEMNNPLPFVLENEAGSPTAHDVRISDIDLRNGCIARFPVVPKITGAAPVSVLAQILRDGFPATLGQHDLARALTSSIYDNQSWSGAPIFYPFQIRYKDARGNQFQSFYEIRVSNWPAYQNVRLKFLGKTSATPDPDLKFEIDCTLESSLILIRNEDEFKPPELAEPIITDEFIIKTFLRIRFRNKAKHTILVEHMALSLLQRSETGEGREIRSTRVDLDVYPDKGPLNTYGRIRFTEEGLSIDGPSISPYYWFWYHMEIPAENVETFDSSYFLRITLIDLDGERYSLDINVDWEKALHRSTFIMKGDIS